MKRIVDNVIIILSLVFITFEILDYYNAKMDFMGNSTSVTMLIIFCTLSILNSIWNLIMQSKQKNKRITNE